MAAVIQAAVFEAMVEFDLVFTVDLNDLKCIFVDCVMEEVEVLCNDLLWRVREFLRQRKRQLICCASGVCGEVRDERTALHIKEWEWEDFILAICHFHWLSDSVDGRGIS